MTTLVLVRHGQATFGAPDYDVLSPLGEQQGVMLGEHWLRCGLGFDSVHSGTMQRQRVTAERALVAMGRTTMELKIDPVFNEYDHVGLIAAYRPLIARQHSEFLPRKQESLSDPKRFQQFFNAVVTAWMNDEPAEGPVAETWRGFRVRCVSGMLAAAGQDERVVVFTSGGVIAALLSEALSVDDSVALRLNWRILNTSVHVFGVSPRGLSLRGYNDIAHLQVAGDERVLTFR